ncbi:hypothetical protein [Leeuwenhoekiella sp. ZYFB001]|uniref:hypothetical protein n=1 Tax=Leeuwenhoekiella sp. ZYFB001 TaxID=2719912 RepID=UPI001431B882|nr:hypothetical protein [Leeuwenhoekiella sp. ZYFB001]
MISFKDIKDAEEGLKSILVFMVMMPFWYSYFGAFYPEILKRSDLVLEICYCFALSISGGLLFLLPSHSYFSFGKLKKQKALKHCFKAVTLEILVLGLMSVIQVSIKSLPLEAMILFFFLPFTIHSAIIATISMRKEFKKRSSK